MAAGHLPREEPVEREAASGHARARPGQAEAAAREQERAHHPGPGVGHEHELDGEGRPEREREQEERAEVLRLRVAEVGDPPAVMGVPERPLPVLSPGRERDLPVVVDLLPVPEAGRLGIRVEGEGVEGEGEGQTAREAEEHSNSKGSLGHELGLARAGMVADGRPRVEEGRLGIRSQTLSGRRGGLSALVE